MADVHFKNLPPIDHAVLHERRERVFLVLDGLFLGTLAMLNILGISRFIVFASWGEEAGWKWGSWGEICFADGAKDIWPQLWLFIGTGYVFKFAIAMLDTIPIYVAVRLLGSYLRIDPT